mmetsp:Transcript_21378/g.68962  ORF Transcript_21378/g.68962 Transcript_21378/m.68962 type:complete len:217 (-) Transcript_21378:834-1484(-)
MHHRARPRAIERLRRSQTARKPEQLCCQLHVGEHKRRGVASSRQQLVVRDWTRPTARVGEPRDYIIEARRSRRHGAAVEPQRQGAADDATRLRQRRGHFVPGSEPAARMPSLGVEARGSSETPTFARVPSCPRTLLAPPLVGLQPSGSCLFHGHHDDPSIGSRLALPPTTANLTGRVGGRDRSRLVRPPRPRLRLTPDSRPLLDCPPCIGRVLRGH